MRGILFTTLAVASLLLGGLPARHAEATTLAPALILGNGAPLIQHVTNVCGANGCVRVQTQRIRHQKPGSAPANHI